MRKLMFLVGLLLFSASIWAQNFPFPQNISYKHGIVASNPRSDKIQSLYNAWVNQYYVESGNMARIKFDEPTETVSEGIGYGMLILVYMDNATNNTQSKFDKVYNYYKKYGRFGGYLMEWKIDGFGGISDNCDNNGNDGVPNCTGSATDGDLDVALALCLAAKQWGDEKYITESKNILDAIYNKQVEQNLIKPGDHWNDAYNPCYFTTASIGLFSQASNEFGFNNVWDGVYDACQTYLKNAQGNSSAGFYPDWTTNNISAGRGSMGFDFSWDACRTPWRVAWDYVWFGNSNAKEMSDKTIQWASSQNVGNVKGPMDLNGNPLSESFHNVCFYGGIGSAFMASESHQSNLDDWYKEVCDGEVDYTRYYAATVQILYMLTMSGNMPNYYDMGDGPQLPRFKDGANNPENSSEITLSFTQELSSGSANSQNDFSFKVDGQSVSISEVSLNPSDNSQLIFVLSEEIAAGTEITVSYSGSSVTSTEGAALEAFDDREVKNTNIDGFLMANGESESVTALGTDWFTFSDNGEGGNSEVDPLTEGTSSFTMTAGGAAGTDNAAKIDFKIDNGSLDYKGYVGLGFPLTKKETDFDMSEASGIAFWHKGSEGFLEIEISTITNSRNYNVTYPEDDEWTQYYFEFSKFKQYDWGPNQVDVPWDATKIVKFQWKVQKENSSGEMWIDEVIAVGMPSPPADKTALNSAIQAAEALLEASQEGEGHNQYSSEGFSALQSVINTAIALNEDEEAKQEDVDAATDALTEATGDFITYKVTIDFTPLESKIADAEGVVDNADIGNGAGQYPEEALTIFEDAIAEANDLVGKDGATDADVAQAIDDLYNATNAFEASKNTTTINTTQLETAIKTASDLVADYNEGDVPAEIYSALNGALEDAQTVVASPESQNQVDGALEALNTAIANYNEALSGSELDLTELNNAIEVAKEAVNVDAVGEGHEEYPSATKSKLEGVIAQAEDVVKTAKTQAEVSSMVASLNAATEEFQNSKVIVDFSDLDEEIQRASDIATAAAVGEGDGEYPQSALDDLNSAITSATNYNGENGVTQEEANEAKADLSAAIEEFQASVNGINTASLDDAIADAKEKADNAQEGEGHGQFSASNIAALNQVIAAAEEIKDNSTDQTDINDATVALKQAISVFENSAIKIDFSELASLLNDANAAVEKGEGSANAIADLKEAIKSANAINEKEGTTESDVANMVSVLKDALDALEDVKPEVDFSALNAEIKKAEDFLKSIEVGTGEGQYPESAYEDLSEEIENAKAVKNDGNVTQSEVDAAKSELANALTDFKATVNTGGDTDFSDLNALISDADELLMQSTVGTGSNEYTESAMGEFSSKIDHAKDVAENSESTQTEVNQAKNELNAAFAEFEKSALKNTISYAKSIVNENVGSEKGQHPVIVQQALQTEIETAEGVVNSSNVSRSQVVSAKQSLLGKITTFEDTKNGDDPIVVNPSGDLEEILQAANDLLSIAEAKKGNGVGHYTSEYIDDFKKNINYATAINNNEKASDSDKDNAAVNLEKSINAFAMDNLFNSLKVIKEFIDEQPKTERLNDLKAVRSTVTEIYNNPTSTTAEILQAFDDLYDAYLLYNGGVDPDPVVTSVAQSEDLSVILYPNPTISILTIANADGIISIIDAAGTPVLQTTNNTIDVSGLPAGSYTVSIVSKESVQTARFVKK